MNADLRDPDLVAAPVSSRGDWAFAALEQHPVAHTLLSADGRILWLNAAAAGLLRGDSSRFLGSRLESLKPCYAERLDLARPSVPSSHTWLRPDGRVGHFAARISRLTDGSLLLIEQDVTEVMRQDHDDDQRTDRLRQLVANSPDAVLILDAAGSIICHSVALPQLLGQPAAALENHNILDFIHADDLGELRQRIASTAHVHSPRRFTEVLARCRHADTSWHWIGGVAINSLTVPGIEAVIVYLRDATRQMALEEELRHRDRRLAALTEHGNDFIAVLSLGGRLHCETSSAKRLLGLQSSDLDGLSLLQLIHPAYRRPALAAYRRLRNRPGERTTLETLLRAVDGTYRWIEASCINLSEQPDVDGILITARDVSLRKGAELERDIAVVCGGIALWDYDTGYRTGRWIGAGMPDLFGTQDGRYTEEGYYADIHPDDVAAVRAAHTQVEEGRTQVAKTQFRVRDQQGRWHWLIERGQIAGFNPLTGARLLAGVSIDVTEQRSTEAQLARVRDQLQFAMDSLQVGYYDWDVVSDVATGIDDWCEQHQLPREGQPGHDARWESYIHPADLREARRRFDKQLRGESLYADLEYRLRRGDGRYVWIMDRSRVVERDAEGRPLRVIGMLANVEARKRVETALLASEARLATAIWGGSFGLWEMDVATQRTHWLSDWCEREDFDACEENHVDSWDTHIHPDDAPAAIAAFSKMMGNEMDSFESEYRVRTRSGQWKWILERSRAVERNDSGQPVKVAGICINIDQTKNAEAALYDAQRAMQTIAANSPDWMFLLDAEGRIRHATRPLGNFAVSELIGKHLLDLTADDPRTREQFKTIAASTLAGGEHTMEQTVHDPRTGQRRYLLHRTRPIQENGRITGMLVTSSDVTDHREREALLRLQARVLETIREGVVLLDARMTVRLTNPAFDRMCGAGKDELLGMRVEALLMTNPSRLLQPGTTVECNVRRLDGSEFAAAAVISSMTVNDEPHALLVLNDVSERKLLEREILEVSSLEQQRIGNDLHDGLGQELTGVALMLRALARRIDREYPNANTEVGEIVALVNHSIESTRALARGLSPVSIERGGLLPALQTLVLRARAAYGITVLIRRYIRRPLRLEADEATHLYRIVQEALTNAVRHGRASRISIAIASDARYINISIRDNGRGFAAGNARRGGIGLKTMHYRAQMLQGELTIGGARGGGTVVRCRCPQGSGAGRDGGMQRLPSELQVTRIFPGS